MDRLMEGLKRLISRMDDPYDVGILRETVSELERIKENESNERCEKCGKRYPEVYSVPDWMWQKVNWIWAGSGGLLCMSCFDLMARTQGMIPYWSCLNGQWQKDVTKELKWRIEALKRK